ncbi:TcpQ domain-containing protein [Pollutimonas harenae]|uniref:TcpQ domain-containing protein n=1 Tax=Pollutimonas harenae TaxID=657015 RepID=A0A853GUE0_9BURK|nr:TcpQ domain-containing protein [Pollutimonas harenae]NYT85767.1 TcpQ domain-containing protein [Pollutimonas harenae]TEA70832.1 hypothetical protein ERD84_09215 [Pollutimonas harenae]
MVKILAASIVLVLLPACAGAPDWFPSALRAAGPVQNQHELSEFSFAWELSGNREVAPLQIFDDGQRVWLQFAPGQPIPAIFELQPGGARPLPYTRQGPYIVLPSLSQHLQFQGGALQSQAKRTKAVPAPATPALDALATSGVDSQVVAPAQDKLPALQALPPETSIDVKVFEPIVVEPAAESVAPILVQHYEVSPLDLTLRAALTKWAGAAGWTFEPEHWALDVDIPIVGSASFALPFKQAVQELVASTELADRPLQPCFYSNRVLRVVPYAQPCNRTVGTARVS